VSEEDAQVDGSQGRKSSQYCSAATEKLIHERTRGSSQKVEPSPRHRNQRQLLKKGRAVGESGLFREEGGEGNNYHQNITRHAIWGGGLGRRLKKTGIERQPKKFDGRVEGKANFFGQRTK